MVIPKVYHSPDDGNTQSDNWLLARWIWLVRPSISNSRAPASAGEHRLAGWRGAYHRCPGTGASRTSHKLHPRNNLPLQPSWYRVHGAPPNLRARNVAHGGGEPGRALCGGHALGSTNMRNSASTVGPASWCNQSPMVQIGILRRVLDRFGFHLDQSRGYASVVAAKGEPSWKLRLTIVALERAHRVCRLSANAHRAPGEHGVKRRQ